MYAKKAQVLLTDEQYWSLKEISTKTQKKLGVLTERQWKKKYSKLKQPCDLL